MCSWIVEIAHIVSVTELFLWLSHQSSENFSSISGFGQLSRDEPFHSPPMVYSEAVSESRRHCSVAWRQHCVYIERKRWTERNWETSIETGKHRDIKKLEFGHHLTFNFYFDQGFYFESNFLFFELLGEIRSQGFAWYACVFATLVHYIFQRLAANP